MGMKLDVPLLGKKGAQSGIVGLKDQDVTGGWRKLRNEKLYDVYSNTGSNHGRRNGRVI
jgi:hypothetical protein